MKKNKNTAFTLIELSIVLVIIALLVGGIMAGRTLYRQSLILSVGVDSQRYAQAALTFQQKYGALPGDFANATSYWSSSFNGDGNGKINYDTAEQLYAWNQLANAQLIQGTYTGVAGANSAWEHIIGTNCPASKIKNGGFGINYIGVRNSSDTTWFTGNYGHAIIFGGYVSGDTVGSAVLAGAEALAIDKKFDDALPATGNIVTFKSSSPTCATTTTPSTAGYNTTGTGEVCAVAYITGF